MKHNHKHKHQINAVKAVDQAEFQEKVIQQFKHLVGHRIEFLKNKAHVFLTNCSKPHKLTWVPLPKLAQVIE